MPWTRSMARGPAPGWPVHGSTVDSPPWPMARLVGGWPSGRSGPQWLAARVEMGRARRGATGGPLTRARMTVWRRRTDDGASVPNGYGAGAIEEGRRKVEGVRCSTEVWGSFYRVGREAGAARNRGWRR
jgi:hypothetical protein